MRILVDMNLTPDWVGYLVAAGFEAVHWSNVGPVAALDAEIMEFAREHGFAILTRDLDFGEILALANHTGPSVI